MATLDQLVLRSIFDIENVEGSVKFGSAFRGFSFWSKMKSELTLSVRLSRTAATQSITAEAIRKVIAAISVVSFWGTL
jgi:hypothetical protein